MCYLKRLHLWAISFYLVLWCTKYQAQKKAAVKKSGRPHFGFSSQLHRKDDKRHHLTTRGWLRTPNWFDSSLQDSLKKLKLRAKRMCRFPKTVESASVWLLMLKLSKGCNLVRHFLFPQERKLTWLTLTRGISTQQFSTSFYFHTFPSHFDVYSFTFTLRSVKLQSVFKLPNWSHSFVHQRRQLHIPVSAADCRM